MEYKVEEIGAKFSSKSIVNLEKSFNYKAEQGYKFHSVIHITKSGCLGSNFGAAYTYLAVYIKEDL